MADIKNKQGDTADNDFIQKAKGQDLRPRPDAADAEASRKREAADARKEVPLPAGRKYFIPGPAEYRGQYFLAGDIVTLQEGDKPSRTWKLVTDEEAKTVLASGLAAPTTDIGKPVPTDKDGHVL